jgi:hypothetical protein
VVVLVGLLPTTRVRANGAFADSQVILLPRAHAHRILASFDVGGLLVSDDDGETWSFICEKAIGRFATLFQLGAAPDEKLYAVTQTGLSWSGDLGCTWQFARGIEQVGDAFPDPRDPQRVLAVAQAVVRADGLWGDVLAMSSDAGRSFGAPLFQTATESITSAEIARSDPHVMYLSLTGVQRAHPFLARSRDSGASWETLALAAQLGDEPLTTRILNVDPDDAATLYLRVSGPSGDALAISRDRGTTMRVALRRAAAKMSAFLLRDSGDLMVAFDDGSAFTSRDGGREFRPWSTDFHVRALAERDGALYAGAESRLDGFAIAVSRDGGEHFEPLLRLEQLARPPRCGSLPQQCDDSWQQLERVLPALYGPSADAGADRDAGERSVALHDRSLCSVQAPGATHFDKAAVFAAMFTTSIYAARHARRRQSDETTMLGL